MFIYCRLPLRRYKGLARPSEGSRFLPCGARLLFPATRPLEGGRGGGRLTSFGRGGVYILFIYLDPAKIDYKGKLIFNFDFFFYSPFY
jgi:hypothetical protein